MKPVHWAVLLVVLLTSGIVMINKYQPNSGMEEIMARPMDEVSSGGLLMSMDVTGLQRPAFSLPDVSGVTRHISEWDGSVIAINFWATWCLPCLKEVPQLVDLQTRYGNEGFQVIGIALQKAEELHEFIQEQAMNYPVLAGEIDVIEVAESYGNQLGVLPYTVIINRDGVINYTKQGAVTGEEVEAIITPLL